MGKIKNNQGKEIEVSDELAKYLEKSEKHNREFLKKQKIGHEELPIEEFENDFN